MRIIGGKHRSRVLKSFEGYDIRPTSDRAREALFNIFSQKIIGSSFYDGFAGSGAVGIEAISRGAKELVFSDLSQKSIDTVKANLSALKEEASVIKCDCVQFLKTTNKSFDIIFLDPPYAKEDFTVTLKIIGERKILNSGGFVIYENEKEIVLDLENLEYVSSRRYGKNCFNIYKTVY